MKKIVYLITIPFVLLALGWTSWATYFRAVYLDAAAAEKKWGVVTLNESKFKSEDLAKRAPMAVNIVKRHLYVGKPMKLVRESLGDPDSYFFSDTIYAYKIIPFPGKDKENWDLVFIPDEKLVNVKEVKIHKKCCYKTPL